MLRILVATHNPGKVAEYADLMSTLPVEWVSLDEAGITLEVEETGTAFEENARLKATAYSRVSGLLTLADDSGLEVDALGGEPGVLSARYGGPGKTDVDRYRLLLRNLGDARPDQRSARFRCVIAVATPEGDVHTAEGVVEGQIGYEPRGEYGFGYDPIFFIPEYNATLAELGPAIKNTISHRARALQAIYPALDALIKAHW